MRIPTVNPVVIFQPVLDEAVLVNPDTADSLVLNSTGILVWQHIDGQRTIDELVQVIATYFDNPPDSINADIMELLDTLAAEEFIGYNNSAPAASAS
ncbi:MAG: PqqD family protein [Anaerolineae bacterium]|nr:PqqD family protein [Anaerolineae bacterium]